MCCSVLQDIVAQADETPTTLYVSETRLLKCLVVFIPPLHRPRIPLLPLFSFSLNLNVLSFLPASSSDLLPFPSNFFLLQSFTIFPFPLSLYIQFEGGLKVTSTVVRGIVILATRVKSPPALSKVSLPPQPLTHLPQKTYDNT